MKGPIVLFQQFPTISLGNFNLRQIKESDFELLKELFHENEDLKFFHFPTEYNEDVTRIFYKFIENYRKELGVYWIIADVNGDKPIGWVTVDMRIKKYFIYGFLTYIIDKQYRNRGIVTQAVYKVLDLIKDYYVGYVFAAVELKNKASVRVLEKNGFVTNRQARVFGSNTEDEVFGLQWKKYLFDVRNFLCREAGRNYIKKNLQKSLEQFQLALEEELMPGCPYTDLQIYANIGIVLSASGEDEEAYRLLRQVQDQGFTNKDIETELFLLRVRNPHLRY